MKRLLLLACVLYFGLGWRYAPTLHSFDFDVDAERVLLHADDRLPDNWFAESGHRAPLLFRSRISEKSGFAQESRDFIMALEPYFYIAIMDDGNLESEAIAAQSSAEKAIIQRLKFPSREDFVRSHPHIQLHLGAAGDFNCEQTKGVPKYCVGRTTFETDRVPYKWCCCTHHILHNFLT